MIFTARLMIGSAVQFDGERWTVKEFLADQVCLQRQDGRMVLMDLSALTSATDYKLLDVPVERDAAASASSRESVSKAILGKADELLLDSNEMEDGHTSRPPETAGIPTLLRGTLVIDDGEKFVSQAFLEACVCLGVDFRLAHSYTLADKAQAERVFRTIRNNFVGLRMLQDRPTI